MNLDRMLIAGEWRPAADGATIDVIDPATEMSVGTVPAATSADLDAALAAAKAGFAAWRRVDAWTRSATLRRGAVRLRERAEEVAAVLTEETGKPIAESRAEAAAAADQLDWYADEARRLYGRVVPGHRNDQRLVVLRQPLGPVAAFCAWNFPALLPMRKVAPALAAGCSVIVKPAEEAPRTLLAIGSILVEAAAEDGPGLPPGAFQIVTGNPEAISTRLLRSGVIRKVSLTGSVPVGRTVARIAGEELIPLSLELGGHSPVLVFADADLDAAVAACVQAKFRNCGQVCISPSRFYVQESIAAAFTERFVAATRSLRIGDGRDPHTDVGPLSNRRRLEAIESLVADAVDHGAHVATGGRRPPDRSTGFFYEPTVLTDVAPPMRLLCEEPFGPLAPITTFGDLDDGLRLANETPYGLAGYVFTRDLGTAWRAGEGLEAGLVGVNGLVVATVEAPFGGVKQSGFGREGGTEGIEAYTATKYINMGIE